MTGLLQGVLLCLPTALERKRCRSNVVFTAESMPSQYGLGEIALHS